MPKPHRRTFAVRSPSPMVVLFTDYGVGGPYMGQLKRVLTQRAPGIPIVDLFADAPRQDPKASAYLLAAYAAEFPVRSVFVAVVDPGVGTERAAAAVLADTRWYVGPENGLFEIVVRRAATPARWWQLRCQYGRLSDTFHGRDLFAPVAASIARGAAPPGEERPIADLRRPHWPDELAQIIYVDGFGNAMSGLHAPPQPTSWVLKLAGHVLPYARTFAEAAPGAAFWYRNANGLVEIAVNSGSAAAALAIRVGSPVLLVPVGSPISR